MNFELNEKVKSLLRPFYFGSIAEDQRILVEQQLLLDSEVLLDYLDLKRSLEAAPVIPAVPSPAVWLKVRERVVTGRRLFVSLSFGAAAVIALVVFLFKSTPTEIKSEDQNKTEILFDSFREHSMNSNVL